MYFSLTLYKGWVLYLKASSGSVVLRVLEGLPWVRLQSADQVWVSSERALSFWVFLWWKAIAQEGNMIPMMYPNVHYRNAKNWQNCVHLLKLLLDHHTQALIFHWPKQVTHRSPKSVVWKRRAADKQFRTNFTHRGGVFTFVFSLIFIWFLLCTLLYFSKLVYFTFIHDLKFLTHFKT